MTDRMWTEEEWEALLARTPTKPAGFDCGRCHIEMLVDMSMRFMTYEPQRQAVCPKCQHWCYVSADGPNEVS